MIEIFHLAGNELAAYRLLGAANELLEPFYLIHFLNRYTFWRYRFATAPDNAPNPIDFDDVDAPLQYVTRAPLPLTKSFIELDDDEGKPLPNPTGGLVKPEEDRVFSEVYMLHN